MGEWRPNDPMGDYPGPPPTVPPSMIPPSSQPPMVPPNPWATYPPPGWTGYALPPGERRPGTLTAGAVLGYVLGGLLILAGILLFFGASVIAGFNNFDNTASSYDTELVFAGLVNLVAAGLLIAGSVVMTGRNANGRVMYAAGGGIVVVASIYWIARWATRDGFNGALVWALIFAALAIVGLSLSFTRADNRWLARR